MRRVSAGSLILELSSWALQPIVTANARSTEKQARRVGTKRTGKHLFIPLLSQAWWCYRPAEASQERVTSLWQAGLRNMLDQFQKRACSGRRLLLHLRQRPGQAVY